MKENGISSGPASLVYIQAKESYPKKVFTFDDPSLSIPFPELSGENVEFLGKCSDAIFAISNFRFFVAYQHAFINIPLMLIERESLEWKGKEFPEIIIYCKNGQSFQLKFDSSEQCGKWYERLKKKCVPSPDRLEHLFAFAFCAWNQDSTSESHRVDSLDCFTSENEDTFQDKFMNEYTRMGFDKDDAWKITDINSKFELCSSYPKLHIIPSHITDEKLENIAKFRTSRRFPSAVWRHSENGAVIVRCSQPGVGWLYWRCEDDEVYLQTLGNVVAKQVVDDGRECNRFDLSDEGYGAGPDLSHPNEFPEEGDLNDKMRCNGVEKKVLVIDCRSYTVAFANRVKGGGSECTEYYPNCKIQFMGLANIHSIRKSFQSLRGLCGKQDEQSGWLVSLEATEWLSHISALIKTSLVVVRAIEQDKQHVVVHCSDGWDRTAQVVSLAELLLDPFYRTIKGFRLLLEREWLAFGHKFADRCGHGCQDDDTNERCPVFLQWLDCVHQLLRQFPCSFEFNETFLVKLVHHTYSCLFGTFLCNTEQERLAANVRCRTCSVWKMLDSQSRNCRNFLYSPQEREVLYPEYQVRNILLWSSLYLSTPLFYFDTSSSNSSDAGFNSDPKLHDGYTRAEPESRPSLVRRNSDGDVKVSSTDDNFVASSGVRDDSDLFLTKSLSCKSCTDNDIASPSKGLMLNNLDRKSNESIDGSYDINVSDQNWCNGKENNSADQDVVGNSNEKNPVHENGTESGHGNENHCVDQSGNGCENISVDQNGSETVDCENTAVDQRDMLVGKVPEPNNIMTCSSDTLVDESCESSNTHKRINTNCSEVENGCRTVENGLETSKARTVSKAINCKSNHRVWRSHSSDHALLQCTVEVGRNKELDSKSEDTSRELLRPTSPSKVCFNKLSKYLDMDGLAIVDDPVQAHLVKLDRCYRAQIDDLQTQLQQHRCFSCLRSKQNTMQDLVSIAEPTSDGPASLSSNAASDCGGWERVDDECLNPVLWVPDHVAVSCGSCDVKFSFTNRKHHCRNCGKVFCSSCCNDTSPVPSELLYDPVRVCKLCFEALHVPNGKEISAAAS